MPACGDLLPAMHCRPVVVGEPTVVKPAGRTAVVRGEGDDCITGPSAYRYQPMPARRERDHIAPLPCPARLTAGLKQVQRPGVVGRRNRHTPDYHAIRGFIKASPCRRRVGFSPARFPPPVCQSAPNGLHPRRTAATGPALRPRAASPRPFNSSARLHRATHRGGAFRQLRPGMPRATRLEHRPAGRKTPAGESTRLDRQTPEHAVQPYRPNDRPAWSARPPAMFLRRATSATPRGRSPGR